MNGSLTATTWTFGLLCAARITRRPMRPKPADHKLWQSSEKESHVYEGVSVQIACDFRVGVVLCGLVDRLAPELRRARTVDTDLEDHLFAEEERVAADDGAMGDCGLAGDGWYLRKANLLIARTTAPAPRAPPYAQERRRIGPVDLSHSRPSATSPHRPRH